MYLSNLELLGFKSFAKKTKIDFHDGITAIVGPNGCGKSNIVDAIRWVLGEQKAGQLRSENMQNVIFNGTRTQKPLGMAEVSLTILNNRNILPIEFSEVVLTRRLFRSGESQYLLNNAVCRLKDIIDLFLDTGMGANAYSVIELSMVERILNGKPEERRQILEEAAGVTKYKMRRKAAFRKLEATEQDLIRLTDIVSEVEKTVNSLRRQVNKARRYRDLSEELRGVELGYSAFHLNNVTSELEPLIQKAQTEAVQKEQVARDLSEKEADLEARHLEIVKIEQQLHEQRLAYAQNQERIQKKEEEILVNQERVKAAEQARQRARTEIDELRQRRESLAEERDDQAAALAEQEATVGAAETALKAAQTALQTIEATYAGKRKEARAFEESRLGVLSKISTLRKEEERLTTEIAYNQRQLAAFGDEKAQLEQRVSQTQEKIGEFQSQKARLEEEIAITDEELAETAATVDRTRENIDATRTHLLELQGNINARRDRINLLRKFSETYEDYPEGVKFLLLGDQRRDSYLGTLGDLIAVEERYRQAVEAALGDAVVGLIVQQADDALDAIARLSSAEKGPVTFMPLDRFAARNGTARLTPPGEGVVGWANELVPTDPHISTIVDELLGKTLVVEELTQALQIARQLNGAAAVTLVTLAGELIYPHGTIRGGNRGSAEASLVGRKAIIEELEAEILDLQEKHSNEQRHLEQQQQRLQQVQGRIEQLDGQRKRLSGSLQEIEVALGQAGVEARRSSERQQAIASDEQRLQEELAQLENRLQELQPQVAGIEQEQQNTESNYASFQSEFADLEAEVKAQESQVQRLQLDLVTRQGEFRNAQQALERMQRTEKEIDDSVQRREQEIRTATDQVAEFKQRIDEVRRTLQDDFAARKTLETKIDEIEKHYRALKQANEEREKAIRQVRSKRDELSDSLHKMELRIAQLKMQRQNLIDQMREAYDIDLQTVPAPESLETREAAGQINDLKQKIRAIGPVNMLALKDYEVEKERLDFLLAQKDDLLRAEENLKETIRVINKTAYDRFNNVFSKVRENFIEVFKSFFENGNADLRLDGDDVLEAEVVIEASPKGKRLGSLALLSGGEKTLTAISLLFAIYLVKPSPFCILDEVDAPLDDNNIGRFTSALHKFSDRTQFIVVTHNKLTMNAAEQLYGITMEEPGVSKVVSVKFEEMKETRSVAGA